MKHYSTCKIFSYSYLVHGPGEAAALRNISAKLEAAEMEEVQVRHARVTKAEIHAGVHGELYLALSSSRYHYVALDITKADAPPRVYCPYSTLLTPCPAHPSFTSPRHKPTLSPLFCSAAVRIFSSPRRCLRCTDCCCSGVCGVTEYI